MSKAQEMRELAIKAKDMLDKEKIERTKTLYEEDLLGLIQEQSENGKFSLTHCTNDDIDPEFLIQLIKQDGFDCNILQTLCGDFRITISWSDPKVENSKKKKLKWSSSF